MLNFLRRINRIISAVFIIFIFLMSDVTATAATIDDLREIIGDKRITDENLQSELKTIIYRYRQTGYKKQLIDLLETMGDFGYEDTLNKLIVQKDNSLEKLEKSFSSNEKEEVIIEKLNSSLTALKELGALKEPDSYIIERFKEQDDEKAYKYAASVLNSKDDTFDIGDVGEGLVFPTKDSYKLYRAFGKNAIITSDIKYMNNRGIDLYVASSPQEGFKAEIISQFNGTVKSIEKKGKSKYRITIKHGSSLITTYEYLSEVVVNKGDKVKQYELLGFAYGETLHFETILNTVSINPLLMYGDLGKQIYDEWYGANPGMGIEATDFANIKKYAEDITIEDKKSTSHPSTVKEDGKTGKAKINLEEGYTKPDVPIVDYIEEDRSE